MKDPAVSSGLSEERDENYPEGVTPECFYRGSSAEFACGEQAEPRLKHAGMMSNSDLTQQSAGCGN